MERAIALLESEAKLEAAAVVFGQGCGADTSTANHTKKLDASAPEAGAVAQVSAKKARASAQRVARTASGGVEEACEERALGELPEARPRGQR